MISTKELWLQKLKPNSANENQPEEIKSPLSSQCSPVELPRIEQLQPINTDISSEIQFHQQQAENIEISKSPDGAGDAIEQVNEADTHYPNEIKDDENQETEKTHTKSDDDHCDVAAVDPQHKKDQPTVKRSSTFLKFLFPKKASSPSTDDVIVTESSITEKHHHHQTELSTDCKDINDSHKTKENHSEQVIDHDDDNNDTGEPSTFPQPDRPSSPLGRRINAFLTRIPTLKEKPSSGTGKNNKALEVDEKIKKESTCVVEAAPDANYEDEKLAGLTTTTVVGANTENSIVAI
ncbi:unnamed protein product [Absidia cylindrospora]